MLVLLVAGDRVQVAPGLVKVPVPVEVKVTDPVGLDFVPPAVSVTVAVQVVDWFTARVESVQLTAVEVERLALKVTVILC